VQGTASNSGGREGDESFRPARAAGVEDNAAMQAGLGQCARYSVDGVVGHGDENMRGMLGQFRVGGGAGIATDEGGRGASVGGVLAGNGGDALTALAQETPERLRDAAGSGDCDWL
jgi:hypothetical protein